MNPEDEDEPQSSSWPTTKDVVALGYPVDKVKTPFNPDWALIRRFSFFVAGTMLIVAIVLSIYYAVMVPILIAAFLAYLLLPIADTLETWKVPRALAAAGILVLVLCVLTVTVIWLLPLVYQQVKGLVDLLPGAITTISKIWVPKLEAYLAGLGLADAEDVQMAFERFSLLEEAQAQLRSGLAGAWRTGTSVANGAIYGALIPIITFFILKDYRRWRQGLRSLVPTDLRPPVQAVLSRVNVTLKTVLKGQATVAAVLACLYIVGLSAVGLKAAIAIGLVAGVCRMVPYLDVIVGGLLSTVVLLADFHGFSPMISVAAVFLFVQVIDGLVVTPLVMRGRVGLHPLLVIVSVLAFASWLGFWGVLLAIPVVAVAKELFSAALPYYRASEAFLAAGKRRDAEESTLAGP